MSRPLFVLSALGLALAGTTGVSAQETRTTPDGEKYNMVIVYGDQPCQESGDPDTITVCARVEDQFRIPEPLRGSASPKNEAWSQKVLAYETVGRTGVMSCSPAGSGGELGCTQQLIDAAYQEKAEGSNVKFGQMIAEAREQRLSQIDAQAEAEQARVEEAEEAYFAQQRRQQAEAEAAEAAEGGGTP